MAKRAATGRPTKLTPDVEQAIAAHIAEGAVQSDAAEATGVAQRTFYQWVSRGELALEDASGDLNSVPTGNRPFAQFAQSVKRARAEARISAVRAVRAAFDSDWRSAMTFLERSDPQNWSRRPPAPSITVEVLDREMRQLIAELKRRAANGDEQAARTLDELETRKQSRQLLQHNAGRPD